MAEKIKNFLLAHWLALAIIGLALFLRLYRISDYLVFLGDEGRDALIVKQMLLEHKFTLLGPTASVGGFYLGPIYYYFMLPFLWLWRLDPTGPAVMVALFGAGTVGLLYWIGRRWFSPLAGLAMAFLMAVSPLVIQYSRTSWNPNLVPFFSLLTIVFAYMAMEKKKLFFWFLAGVALGINLQLHYLTLIFLGILAAFIPMSIGISASRRGLLTVKWKELIKTSLATGTGIILGWLPFLAFEVRHRFPNFSTILRFSQQPDTLGSRDGLNIFGTIHNLGTRIFCELLSLPPNSPLIIFLLWGTIVVGFVWLIKERSLIAKVILGYFLIGIIGLSQYRGQLHSYYFGFLFPAVFLMLGLLIKQIEKIKFGKWMVLIFLIWTAYRLWPSMPWFGSPNRQLNQTREIVEFVLSKTNNKPYNFALMTDHNSDHAYRYFLEILGSKPVIIENEIKDPLRKTAAEQLLAICELKTCQPLGYPLWEIAGFGRAEIDGDWLMEKYNIRIFRLKHWQTEIFQPKVDPPPAENNKF